MFPDTHLMDYENGRERRMAIPDVNGDGLAVKRPKTGFIRVVDKYEFLNLTLVNLGPKQRQIKLTSGQKRISEVVVGIKKLVMGWAHKQAIAWFMMRFLFGLRRDPIAVLEVGPLSRISLDLRRTHMPFNLQRTPATA